VCSVVEYEALIFADGYKKKSMKLVTFFCAVLIILTACQSTQGGVSVVLSPPVEASPRVIYVTPTQDPSPIPTIQAASPTPTQTRPPAPTNTPDLAALQAQCRTILTQLYATASDACLRGSRGTFCNGGLPPRTDPGGNIENSLAVRGAQVTVDQLAMVQLPPLLRENSGGVMWMRLPSEIALDALLIGDVHVRDVTPTDSGFAPWLSFTVETSHTLADCTTAPYSSFVMQSQYGGNVQAVVNGASVDVAGTLVVQTHSDLTSFIALEGRSRVTVFGTSRILYAGEQVDVLYNAGDYSRPTAIPELAFPLAYKYIANLPIVLLDRPVLLPQPGNLRTIGRTNMRAEPDIDSLLLYQVPANEPVSILGQNTADERWYHVRLGNGDTGWMRSDLVQGTMGEITSAYDATPVPPSRYGDKANMATISVPQGGNLRRAPDIGFAIMRTLPPGTEVELLARSPYSNWVKVDADGTVGWMSLITMDTAAVIRFLPIDYDVPLPPRPTVTPVYAFGGGHAYPDSSYGQ
jgi:SH3-like domain-containing protein